MFRYGLVQKVNLSFPSVVNSEDFRIDDPKMGRVTFKVPWKSYVELMFFHVQKKYNSVQSSSSKLNLISSKLTNLNVTREKNAAGGGLVKVRWVNPVQLLH